MDTKCKPNNKWKAFFGAVIVFAINSYLSYKINSFPRPNKTVADWNMMRIKSYEERCGPPSLDLFHEDVVPYMKQEVGSMKCVRKAVRKENNKSTVKLFEQVAFRVEGRYLRRINYVGAPCCVKQITKLERYDKIDISSIACVPLKGNDLEIEASVDYVVVMCQDNNTGAVVYMDAFHMVYKKKNSTPPTSPSPSHLNILMFGIDSGSQLNFLRTMPLSHEFLIRNLSGTLLKGYNVVGDCTHSNIIPLLTGQSAYKFRETCAKPQELKKKHVRLDNCSFIWNAFARKGYLTSLAEDYAEWSPFSYYYPNCFEKAPTHFYLSPVSLLLEPYYVQELKCVGLRPGYEAVAEFLRTIAEVNEGTPLFQFGFTGALAYHSMNGQKQGDGIFLSLLQKLSDNNILNNTALFIFGDHGFRSTKKSFRLTVKGAIEVRMPIGIIVLPKWFRTRHPDLYSNMILNSQNMISHYDIHKTLLHILDLSDANNTDQVASSSDTNPGTSLFLPIGNNRTCLSAGIPLYWCLHCHPKNFSVDNDIKIEVAHFILKMIKNGWKNICDPRYIGKFAAKLTLKSVVNASKWDSRDLQRELCTSSEKGLVLPGYFGQSSLTLNISCDRALRSEEFLEIIQVQIETMNWHYRFFSAEVIRYRNQTDGEYYLHLTEDIRYI